MSRIAKQRRDTKETQITASLNLDGSGKSSLDSGIRFFDHMLDGFARHGLFDLEVHCQGDIEVDSHHSIEDIGIVLGNLIKEAIGDKQGIRRYGHFLLPMDEALVLCAIDLSGRPYFVYHAQFMSDRCGEMDTQMAKEFFYAVSYAAGMNLHIEVIHGENDHHIMEAMFKAFGKALDMAVGFDERITGVLSTKGVLE